MTSAKQLLLGLGYAAAILPLAGWGANSGANVSLRLAWIMTLLAYALGQMVLSQKPGMTPLQQRLPLLDHLCIGTVMGYLLGSAMIGFDNMGFGNFLGFMLVTGCVGGFAAGLIRLADRLRDKAASR